MFLLLQLKKIHKIIFYRYKHIEHVKKTNIIAGYNQIFICAF